MGIMCEHWEQYVAVQSAHLPSNGYLNEDHILWVMLGPR